MIVTSGYRSPEHNGSLRGAARTSYHMDGIAFDVMMTNHDPHAFVAAARAAGFTGIGTYPGSNFIHIDTRGDHGAAPARWGQPFPETAAAFAAPEPQPRPEASPAGRAGVGLTGAGAAVALSQVAPTVEAASGLSDAVQIALIVGAALIALALIVWGPDGIRAALRRLRAPEDDL